MITINMKVKVIFGNSNKINFIENMSQQLATLSNIANNRRQTIRLILNTPNDNSKQNNSKTFIRN